MKVKKTKKLIKEIRKILNVSPGPSLKMFTMMLDVLEAHDKKIRDIENTLYSLRCIEKPNEEMK